MLSLRSFKTLFLPVRQWGAFERTAWLIISMHFFGFGFMLWQPTSAFFVSLTPLNLLASLGAMLYFHTRRTAAFLLSCLLTWAGGFLIELAGVQTGAVFGRYAYGEVLGIKLWETPLIIGVNWLLLIYALAALTAEKNLPVWQKALFTGAGMTLTDLLIEPFAVRFGLWHWYGEPVPLQNYFAWFVAGSVMAAVFLYINKNELPANRMAAVVLFSQLAFFCAHNVAILLQ